MKKICNVVKIVTASIHGNLRVLITNIKKPYAITYGFLCLKLSKVF